MMNYRSCFVIACVAHLAGCSEPSFDEAQFTIAWEYEIPMAERAMVLDDPIRQTHHLAFDNENRLYVVLSRLPDPEAKQGCAAILKFAADGTRLETLPFDRSQPPVQPFEVCPPREFIGIDGADAILTGSDRIIGNDNGETYNDLFLRKLDGQGKSIWTQYHYGAVGYSSYFQDLAIDPQNNIILAATGGPLNGTSTPWIGKYDPQGNLLWTHEVATFIDAIDVDEKGNIWYLFGDDASNDTLLGKLDPAGNSLVTIPLESSRPGLLELAPDGSPVLYFYSSTIKKYSTDGALLWETTPGFYLGNPRGDLYKDTRRIAVGPDGSVYGIGDGIGSNCNCGLEPPPATILIKYGADDGRMVGYWVRRFGSGSMDMIIGKNGAMAVIDTSIWVTKPLE